MGTTVTEALAEIKTITKRLNKKREFILNHATRDSKMVDPLEKDGGSESVLKQELQSVSDLERRVVALRSAINNNNHTTKLTAGGKEKTIAEWLIWRREVMPSYRKFLNEMSNIIKNERDERFSPYNRSKSDETPSSVNVHVNEKALGAEVENLEAILGELDGRLSLLNATVNIEVD